MADIGELTAQWLEGGITYQPGYGAPGPDSETSELVSVLSALNRAGFVTIGSQPGVPLTSDSGQRAFVVGFCSEELAGVLRLTAMASGVDLVVLAFAPGVKSGPRVVVTVDGGEEFTLLGQPIRPVDVVDIYRGDLPADGVAALQASWQLQIFDPRWGRNDLLWSFLAMVAVRAEEWLGDGDE